MRPLFNFSVAHVNQVLVTLMAMPNFFCSKRQKVDNPLSEE